ncbi:hypothetical protein P152DRAFT_172580 [Eremomyces bilateralis CBS 781.70]|uniref:Uncharacterized protein n=1 Tax=Eremomyces bilateralis CBS 781.70 TaxID=1392243 RepID=A0A6G1FTJ6_9PEZI|nr:uncharacterized protein P152DRAFT_172580 [Eremomyces bilateralis CBS 781.70]KAF1809205.1 hypothetical protein P152DRAFT_172580 [Eremomyces bilateralis CBS 781.70]
MQTFHANHHHMLVTVKIDGTVVLAAEIYLLPQSFCINIFSNAYRIMQKRQEYDSPRRVVFFRLYDQSKNRRSFRSICRQKGIEILPSTGIRWLENRKELGPEAVQRTRGLSKRRGRPRKLDNRTLQRLLDPQEPLYDKDIDYQAKELGVGVSTLHQNLSKRLNARHYKNPSTTAIRDINKGIRKGYGEEHRGKTLTQWWKRVYFTDEVHFNSRELADKQEYELRSRANLDALNQYRRLGVAPLT